MGLAQQHPIKKGAGGAVSHSVEPTLISWWKGYFLIGEIFSNILNLWDHFLIGIPIIMVGQGTYDIFIPESLETTHTTWVSRRCGFQQTVSFLSVHSKVSVCLLTFLSGSHFYPLALGVCSVRFGWFCMCMVNRNRIFRLVKFSTEIDRNGRKSIDFGGISVSVSFGFPKRGFGG